MIRRVYNTSRRERKKAMQSRAWLNGVEVTRDAFYADDTRGIVHMYLRNANGNHYRASVGGFRAATAILRGRVVIGRAKRPLGGQ